MLASASPRRSDLLRSLGLQFEIRPVELDESRRPGEPPHAYVERLATAKAQARAAPGELVLAADTVVVLEGQVLGKPRDRLHAREMLCGLAGRWHQVLTAVALEDKAALVGAATVVESRVKLATMTAHEIDWYVATGEPDDKAGGYAIQGLGALFVEEVHGSYTNVVGLPLPTTYRLLAERGYDLKEG